MDDDLKESYYSMLLHCSVRKLVPLTRDSNAAVRAMVFSGLLRMRAANEELAKIMLEHQDDTAGYSSTTSCVANTIPVNDFMRMGMDLKAANKLLAINYLAGLENIARQRKFYIQIKGMHHGLTPREELLKLDSLVYGDKKVRILSFDMLFGEKIFKGTGNILTAEMKAAIRAATPKDFLAFDVIKVMYEGKRCRFASVIIKFD